MSFAFAPFFGLRATPWPHIRGGFLLLAFAPWKGEDGRNRFTSKRVPATFAFPGEFDHETLEGNLGPAGSSVAFAGLCLPADERRAAHPRVSAPGNRGADPATGVS